MHKMACMVAAVAMSISTAAPTAAQQSCTDRAEFEMEYTNAALCIFELEMLSELTAGMWINTAQLSHDLVRLQSQVEPRAFGMKVEYSQKCGGDIDLQTRSAYMRGLQSARKLDIAGVVSAYSMGSDGPLQQAAVLRYLPHCRQLGLL